MARTILFALAGLIGASSCFATETSAHFAVGARIENDCSARLFGDRRETKVLVRCTAATAYRTYMLRPHAETPISQASGQTMLPTYMNIEF